MKDLYIEIHDLYSEGMAPVNIATKLNVPLYMVSGALAMQTTPEVIKAFDGQPVMNERIKELMEQAGIQDNPDQEGLEYFAELIVRECLSYAKDGDLDFMKFMIKKNFGVEE